jgi:hypothetical protein
METLLSVRNLKPSPMMKSDAAAETAPLFCDRCGTELRPGSGNYYVVKIEAVADPAPPRISEPDLDIRQEIERLLARMKDLSEQEAMDQVYRRLILYLCRPCYSRWIEDPTA